MRLLLAEDDDMIGRHLEAGLRDAGFSVDRAADGVAADLALQQQEYGLVLLDLGLPRADGLTVLRQLRQRGAATPVLILTARDAVADRIAGLDAGADDYLVKPFDFDELLARIRAVQRRHAGRASPLFEHGALRLDPASHQVWLGEREVALSAREYALLFELLQKPGTPLSRARLENRLYGWDEEVASNAVEVHIHALRRKLGAAWILNLRGVGYYVPRQPPEAA
ncbi:response regulator [Jeongeupia sp. USM3]|uniref:response regulator n=1 Tax=Jeongeupia sp. USM3 TaxID=1906741 RepID=UPI00089DF7B6|nr:response regulator [Jeongeupia sp. USM3]AOY02019.1 DNA-binding response regulator [Jeongeupia sp. USM3]